MVVKGINFKSYPFAALVAGYMMVFVDGWLKGFIGLFGIFPGASNAVWFITHLMDSMVFALLFAWPAVYNKLPGGGWLKGMVFGFLFWILVSIISFISGALGATMFKQMQFTASAAFSGILLHLVYGFFLGILYVPAQSD
ncbi:MAG: hypothetical protein D6814_04210 [Calditrichaeota bacterium]|nr:MAG: hypothetical protein D6814_04210 [Calditrichota bacterium]